MENFQLVPPSPILSSYVKHYWILEADQVSGDGERIIPSGTIQLLFYNGDSIRYKQDQIQSKALLCGQSTSYTDIFATSKIRIISVVFRAYGARAFFRMPMTEVVNKSIVAGDMEDKALRDLEQRITGTEDNRECIRLLEDFFISRLCPFKEYNLLRLHTAIRTINQNPGELQLTGLSESVCLSYKQFKRIFSEHVGINPKDFLRIVRFQKALFTMQESSKMSFAQVAYECGYYDQSHMINEFKTFSGYTPTE